MQEWLFLLLPVAAASGWFAAKSHYTKKYLIDHSQALRRAYCRGLNYLLSEKTDKAIETFANLLVSDYETIETHIALGNLYRRRGELEKAIQIHEKLISQDKLNEEQRTTAYFELGMDYLRGGLFDRAEVIFSQLTDHGVYRKAALQQLLQIYLHERDWRKASHSARQLAVIGKLTRGESVAQFLCELAEETLAADQDEEAFRCLEEALREDPACVRANLLIAKMRMREGRFEEAMQALRQVESQNPAYLPEVLEPLRVCHERLNRPVVELMGYLGYLYETYGFHSAALALAEQLRAERGVGRAAEHLQRVLEGQPSLKTLSALTGLLLEDGMASPREALIRIDRAVDRMSAGKPRYACIKCGFSGAELHWCCPSCRCWESTRPVDH